MFRAIPTSVTLACHATGANMWAMINVGLRSKPPSPSDTSLTGQVLIAMPGLPDPEFAKSVIYLCSHSPEGAMGIIVNRPINTPSFADLLGQLEVSPTPPARAIALCQGGPVDLSRGFVLHSADWTGDGSLRVDSDVALTASIDVLTAIANGGGPREGILALGYANWGPGQLDDEIRQNSWLNAQADTDLLFDADHDSKWARAMAKLHVQPGRLSSLSGHA
jgi:putative transcriptional regulator